ncbi:adp-sugar pyrophosphatase [Anaeramoeba flamelloides]|uniref:Adp-sugar pyrophosphatase n=1 Tax=Anaeramoeba flamelloides TaxID=1746091 RepID=A0ABQ8XZK3_9EUKA|nr:adp-sugar pyrophosphatase [Anaeramoeba flamelloides]
MSKRNILGKGKFLQVCSQSTKTNGKQKETFEFIARPMKDFSNKVYAVVIIATLGDKLILIEQKRHAVKKRVLEFPAGLVEDLDLEACALRELKEETGYIGVVTKVTGMVSYAQKYTGGIIAYAFISCDPNLEQNKNPIQDLEGDEFIQARLIKPENLRATINEFKKGGGVIDYNVEHFALGLDMNL